MPSKKKIVGSPQVYVVGYYPVLDDGTTGDFRMIGIFSTLQKAQQFLESNYIIQVWLMDSDTLLEEILFRKRYA